MSHESIGQRGMESLEFGPVDAHLNEVMSGLAMFADGVRIIGERVVPLYPADLSIHTTSERGYNHAHIAINDILPDNKPADTITFIDLHIRPDSSRIEFDTDENTDKRELLLGLIQNERIPQSITAALVALSDCLPMGDTKETYYFPVHNIVDAQQAFEILRSVVERHNGMSYEVKNKNTTLTTNSGTVIFGARGSLNNGSRTANRGLYDFVEVSLPGSQTGQSDVRLRAFITPEGVSRIYTEHGVHAPATVEQLTNLTIRLEIILDELLTELT